MSGRKLSETEGRNSRKRKRIAEHEAEKSGNERNPKLQHGPKATIGVGVAYTYLFGFLPIAIRGFWNKFKTTMANYGITDANLLVKKMLIIVPKSVNSPSKLEDLGVNQTNFSIKQTFDRAGKKRREYTLSIYKLDATDQNKNEYYFIADFPACLFALRDACDYGLMKKDEVFEARNEFVQTVKDFLNHPNNQAKFRNKWELLEWPDDEDPWKKLSEFLHGKIENKRLGLTKLSHDATREPVNAVGESLTFVPGRGIMDYPMYAEGQHYDLKYSNRGYCVIISNYEFDEAYYNRSGGQVEIKKLEKLFKALKFKVRIHINLTSDKIKTKLATYNKMDHSKSDAFVCCLLSHGTKGHMFGTGGWRDSISVVELMELFYDDKCTQLKGKPKLFFIGTCQSDEFSAKVMKDLIPSNVDFIVSYACLPNTAALRDPEKGGLYVQALCKHLTRDLEIDVALRHVNKEVRHLWDKYAQKKRAQKKRPKYPRPDPFHIIIPPQKFLFLNSI